MPRCCARFRARDGRQARTCELLADDFEAAPQGWNYVAGGQRITCVQLYAKTSFVVVALSSQPRVGSLVTELMSLIEI